MEIALSVNKVPIRLTDERWIHIVENHDELAGLKFEVLETVSKPDFITEGWQDELVAVRSTDKKHIVVIYKETSKNDGFIITAFLTKRIRQIKKRKILWQKQS